MRGIRGGRYRDLVALAQAQGWTADHAGNGHLLLRPPGGGKPVAVSMTMEDKDNRAYLNTRAALRRGGLRI